MMPLINSRNSFINECGLEHHRDAVRGYAIALGVPFDGVHDGSGTESGCIQWYRRGVVEDVVVGIGGDGVGGRRGRRRSPRAPPVSTASSSVKAPSGCTRGRRRKCTSLVEVE